MANEPANLDGLADRINAAHDDAFRHAKAAVLRASDVGELLAQAKAQVGHGGWLSWVKGNCRFGDRQARKYIRAFENWDAIRAAMEANRNSDSDLTLDGALALIADPAPRKFPEMEAHPQCSIVPDMTAEEFDGLCESMARHGLGTPIVTFKGKILDGRQRYRACRLLDVEPRFEEFIPGPQLAGRSDEEIILGYLEGMNLGRSGYTVEQRAEIHAKLACYSSGLASSAVSPGDRKTLTKEQAQSLMDEALARMSDAEECWMRAKAMLVQLRSKLQGDDLAAYLATFDAGKRGALLWAVDHPEASFVAAVKRYPSVFGWKAEHLDMLEPFV